MESESCGGFYLQVFLKLILNPYHVSGMARTSPRTAYVRAGFSPHPRRMPKTLACLLGVLRASPVCASLLWVLLPACAVGWHPYCRSRLTALSPSTWRGSSLPTLLGPACVLHVPHRANLARGVGSPPHVARPYVHRRAYLGHGAWATCPRYAMGVMRQRRMSTAPWVTALANPL